MRNEIPVEFFCMSMLFSLLSLKKLFSIYYNIAVPDRTYPEAAGLTHRAKILQQS